MFDHHEKFGNQEICKSYHLQAQKNFPSGRPGQVDFLAGQAKSQNLPAGPVILTKKLAFSKSFC